MKSKWGWGKQNCISFQKVFTLNLRGHNCLGILIHVKRAWPILDQNDPTSCFKNYFKLKQNPSKESIFVVQFPSQPDIRMCQPGPQCITSKRVAMIRILVSLILKGVNLAHNVSQANGSLWFAYGSAWFLKGSTWPTMYHKQTGRYDSHMGQPDS